MIGGPATARSSAWRDTGRSSPGFRGSNGPRGHSVETDAQRINGPASGRHLSGHSLESGGGAQASERALGSEPHECIGRNRSIQKGARTYLRGKDGTRGRDRRTRSYGELS